MRLRHRVYRCRLSALQDVISSISNRHRPIVSNSTPEYSSFIVQWNLTRLFPKSREAKLTAAIPEVGARADISVTTTNQIVSWRPARVLVPTDLSPISENALNYADSLARQFNSHVYVTHVLTNSGEEPNSKQTSREDAERKIAETLESGKMPGAQYTVLLEEGFLWQTLEGLIRKYGIDLVVVGTHGRKHSTGEFQGSWAELIFRNAECPVMTVGPACEEHRSDKTKISRILFATDFGRAAEHAVPYACSLSWDYGAELTLLNVVEKAGNFTETEWALLHETTRIRLLESLPSGMKQRFKVEYLVQRGDSAREILSMARSKKMDLIVMGAKIGRKLVTHLPEPTAYTVAVGAPCPVLTVTAY